MNSSNKPHSTSLERLAVFFKERGAPLN